MTYFARAIGAGQGDKATLLALVAAIHARLLMIERAIDLRLAASALESRS